METYNFDTVVIGAGVVGLSIARALAFLNPNILLLEREKKIGMGISSRNSEVIHSGIYYEKDSLKARLCVKGKDLLYQYCAERGVNHQRLGKLIVATNDFESEKLELYLKKGNQNGVNDLEIIDKAKLAELEPEIHGISALFSPSTGIIDSHQLMEALLEDFENTGGLFVRESPVLSGSVQDNSKISIQIGGSAPCVVNASLVINAAGLDAPKIARSINGYPTEMAPGTYYAIGHYYTLSGKSPFKRLIYPIATAGGLGVHLTLDLDGNARFGPDISWRDNEDYTFDDSRRDQFIAAIRKYWLTLPEDRLYTGYTGIRPKLWGPSKPEQDFMIQGQETHGITGLINLFGIESPGLTSSLAIAELVTDLYKRTSAS